MKQLTITEAQHLITNDNFYILMVGSVGAGKSFIINKYFSDLDCIDIDDYTISLGNGEYDGKNVSKAIKMSQQAVKDKLQTKKTFIHQGTSANLSSTINKIINAQSNGYKVILFYIDTTFETAKNNINNRVKLGGRGDTITDEKIKNSIKYSKFTFEYLTHIKKNFNVKEKEIITKLKYNINLDYFIHYTNY